ncbi:MAG: protein-export chaperone SecB [Verrucomicrobia bacterium]|nr:protein-export chaperone SecB [Verrucomicrobiota bacterium]
MIPSPLLLECHYFTRVNVEAAADVDSAEADAGVFKHRIDCKRHKEESRRFMLTLGLKRVAGKKEGTPHYTWEIEVVGFLTVDAEYPEEKVEALVKVNGPAVLYAAAREMVANITSRGPFPAVNLPTVTFVDELTTKTREKTRAAQNIKKKR